MTFDRDRFVKFMGMTGSAMDAEALAFIRRATAMLKEAGLTWGDVILADPKPAPLKGERPQPPPFTGTAHVHPDPFWSGHNAPGFSGFAEAVRRAKQATAREQADEYAARKWKRERGFTFGFDPGSAAGDAMSFAFQMPDGSTRVHAFHRQQGKTMRESLEHELFAAGYSLDDIKRAVDAAGL